MSSNLPSLVLPPSDGTVTLDTVVDFHAKHNPKHTFAILYDIESRAETTVTYEQLSQAVHRAAHILNPNASLPQGTNIGILISADAIAYITLVQGAMRAGLVPFPISPRTPVEGIAHLLSSTQTTHAVVGGSPAINGLYQQVETHLSEQTHKIQLSSIPALNELYPHLVQDSPSTSHSLDLFPSLKPTANESIISIVHSSGSTGLPRAVPNNQEGIFKNVLNQPLLKGLGGPGVRTGLMALPTFHATGLWIKCMASMYQGFTQVLFAPRTDPVVPTADLMLQALLDTGCESTIAWPTFLEIWAQDDAAIAGLKKLRMVLFGGGPLTERVGDHLVSHGVNIQIAYAGTEFGAGTHPCPPGYDSRDWIYFKFSDTQNVQLVPQCDEQGSHEVFFVMGPNNKPFMTNSEVDGKPAYSTKDLVIQHPTKPELWKVVGRADDQITLSNGEKINPGPIENTILKSSLVQFVAMFGREKSQTGVLIELTAEAHEAYHHGGHAQTVDAIWSYVEEANSLGPTHARLAKDTVIFTTSTRPVPRTAKGNVSRPGALKAYAEDIENMYAALEKSGHYAHDVGSPESWKEVSKVEFWVKSCVEKILGRTVDTKGDLFQQGMDSLSAAILIRVVKSGMHASSDSTIRAAEHSMNRNTVFVYPTVKQLSSHLVQLCSSVTGSSETLSHDHESILAEIRAMIQKYDSNWTTTSVSQKIGARSARQSVVLTGSTGGLGCHLLATLLADDNVDKIWALNRKSLDGVLGIEERQIAAFEDKLLDSKLLEHPKLSLLEVSLESERLGLAQQVYTENAWQVNFNLTLQSFEPSIQGTQNLLKLAFNPNAPTGLPRFVFASSVSAAGFGYSGTKLREKYIPLEHGINNIGYGRSKLVAEKLLESARSSGLETCIIRLGQLTGDGKSGAWSTNDWVPSMIASSASVACLPDGLGHTSWVALDTAALVVHEVTMDRSAIMPKVVHCAHPRPVLWSDMAKAFANVLGSRIERDLALEVVPFGDWNRRIIRAASTFEGSQDQKHRKYPTTRIQDLFDGMVQSIDATKSGDHEAGAEMGGTITLDMTEALALSNALRSVKEVDETCVEKWVYYWEKRGLFA